MTVNPHSTFRNQNPPLLMRAPSASIVLKSNTFVTHLAKNIDFTVGTMIAFGLLKQRSVSKSFQKFIEQREGIYERNRIIKRRP